MSRSYRSKVLNLRTIRHDVSVEDVAHYVYKEAKSRNQKIVQEYCRTPINHIFTTKGIPGIEPDLAEHLRRYHDIKNPLDFVKMLRFKTRGRRRQELHVCASIVANFLDDVWFYGRPGFRARKTTAAISIAMSDFMLRKCPV